MKKVIGIQLQVLNYNDEIRNILLEKLKNIFVACYHQDVRIDFARDEECLKFVDEIRCWFIIYANFLISVQEVMNLLDLTYYHKIISESNEPDYEEAIWASHVNAGIFLDSHVVWACVYTYCIPKEE